MSDDAATPSRADPHDTTINGAGSDDGTRRETTSRPEGAEPHTSDAPHSKPAKFVTGSLLRHILVMTGSGATGLMALFLVDLADIYFLSLLGEVEVAAAIGYAGSILFLTVSVGIGLAIATGALVSRALGADEADTARRLATSCLLFAAGVATVLGIVVFIAIPSLLTLLGAQGRALELATGYLQILIPTMPVIALGITGSGVLRAVGDGKRAMYVTLTGGIVNGLLDPVLIFWAGLGVDGAALASLVSRFALAGVALWGVVHVHAMVRPITRAEFLGDVRQIVGLAGFAILTNVATPVGNAFVTAAFAPFGVAAVAGWAVISRLMPVAFGAIFALSGAIGPIIGQNIGARQPDRVRETLLCAAQCVGVYLLGVWLILALASGFIAEAFSLSAEGAELVGTFARFLVPLFGFFGLLFIANAAFNNLGKPHYSSGFNWLRATAGTVPFLWAGGLIGGATGALAGYFLGGVLFGAGAFGVALYQVERLRAAEDGRPTAPFVPDWANQWAQRWRMR